MSLLALGIFPIRNCGKIVANARAEVKISGLVQGVFFRSYTRDRALGLKLCGWVRNMPDGSVSAVFEGEEDAIREMLAWCQKGPPSAIVRDVGVKFKDWKGEYKTFNITR